MISMIKKSYPKLITSIRFCSYDKTFKDNDKITTPINNLADCDGEAKKWPTGNRIHYKFHSETENSFNQQINAEFTAFYNYLSMAAYFGRVDVALPGCESFFMQMHDEEREHALQFIKYVKMRGGLVKLYPIDAPIDQDWKCPLFAFKTALELEITVSNKLVTANLVAEKHGDLNASDYIITEFMENQMKSINELAKFTTILSGIGDKGLSRFIFDQHLLSNHVSSQFNVLKDKKEAESKPGKLSL